MRKIGLLTMALVLALGSLGMAYAAWTDEITIEGSVSTGTVELNVVDYSGTWIYKNLRTDELVNLHCWSEPDMDPELFMLVSYGAARAGDPQQVESDVVVEFRNIFPCQDIMADVLLHYNGTVPAKLFAEVTDVWGDKELIEKLDVEFMAWKLLPSYIHGQSDIHDFLGQMVDVGVQVHQCDMILVAMVIHLPQDNDLMDLGAKFTARIQAIQWNEFQEGAGFYPYPA